MKEKTNQKIKSIIVFAVMFLFLQMQFHHVMVYFDDYGYYSLSYGMENASGGNQFSFSELLSFLKLHYFDVNGRIPGYLMWLSLYILGGLTLVQVTAATIVTIILVVLWKFIDNQKHSFLSALLVCGFYGLISLDMHRQGTYWFAAFFQYVAPVFLIVLFVKLYFQYRENTLNIRNIAVLAIVAFFAAYSQEQLSVTVTFMMCLILIYELINRKANIHNIVFIVVSALAIAALLLSPSSQNRASSGYPFFERIIYSTYQTICSFFSADISVLVILLHTALFIFSIELFKEDKHIFKLMDLCGISLALFSIIIYICRPIISIIAEITLNRYYLLIVVGIPCIAVIAIQIMRYYWTKKKDAALILFMTAVGSVGCLCFVPEVPKRLFISSWLLLFPLLSDGIFKLMDYVYVKKGEFGLRITYLLCAGILLLSTRNIGYIYQGYSENSAIYQYNDKQLSAASEYEKNGAAQEKIFLKKLSEPNCAAAAIYHEEVTFMNHWIKAYYDFDNVPLLYFNESGDYDDQYDSYSNHGNNVFVKMN